MKAILTVQNFASDFVVTVWTPIFVGIFAANARQIGTGTLGTPLERMVVHALGCERVMAVALDFIA